MPAPLTPDNIKPVKISRDHHSIRVSDVCDKARKVLKRLNDAGYDSFLVGGAVRDLLLGKLPKDFDIATSARPEDVKQLFSSCRLIGRRFRLAHVYFGRHYLEIATFRAPHDGSGKGVTGDNGRIINDNVYGTVEEDVWRRDFTVNALLFDIRTEEVWDYVGAAQDLDSKRLTLIGNPASRYREDPVRMLRAIRFSSKLGLQISPETEKPIYELGHLLGGISPARLFDESLKLFHCGKAVEVLAALKKYNLLQYLFPYAAESLEDPIYDAFVNAALANTDKRIEMGLSVTPSFLYAVMLWNDIQLLAREAEVEGYPLLQAYHVAAGHLLKKQARHTAVPRRVSNMSRDIWALQTRFRYKDCRRAFNFLEHQRFRAAYDFHCLRAKAGEIPESECQWWTDFQEKNEDEQREMCSKTPSARRRRRRKRK